MASLEDNELVQDAEKSVSVEEPGAIPNSESEVKTDADSKILFKKPQMGLIIGPRRGKITAKFRTLELSTDAKTRVARDVLDRTNVSCELKGKVNNCNRLRSDNDNGKEVENNRSVGVANTTSDDKRRARSSVPKTGLSPAQQIAEKFPIPYKEPKWGGCPEINYSFEVLKSGKILEKVDLRNKSFFAFGRLANCDVMLAHLTISRHHAVLQYRSEGSQECPRGFYIYDLGSTHGTFLNKNKIKPNMYVRLHVGHILKFGCSTRLFVLQGPPEDEEEESDLTVTEMKQKRQVELLQRLKNGETVTEEEGEGQGIDWGMGEDADEETDLAVNPFASTQNEELYLDDPKKTLRGWFEREGLELEYDVEERGVAQFLCRVELPVETARGGVVTAEAVVHGKKKEAVVQCALEACRILDRYGLLRQATHESKKRKTRDWASEDFYDSDDDTFLDRTGDVEQKRQARMRAAGKREVLTYQHLLEQHEKVSAELRSVEARLHKETSKDGSVRPGRGEDEDELDAFMSNLSAGVKDKLLISKLKSSLAGLKAEEARLRKLVDLARPADLPEPTPRETEPSTSAAEPTTAGKVTSILGRARKRIRSKQGLASELRTHVGGRVETTEGEEDDEEEEDEGVSGTSEGPDREERVPDVLVSHKDVPTARESSESEVRVAETSERREDEEVDEHADPSRDELAEKQAERRRKRNRNRMMQRNAKMKKETKGEWSDPKTSDPSVYSTWTPPVGQSGDGRTSLNEKLGY